MFTVFVHLKRLRTFLVDYFRNLEKVKSLIVAGIAIIFCIILFFVITWSCVAIQAALSMSNNGGMLSGAFNSLRNGFAVLRGEDHQAGVYSTKSVETNFVSKNRIRKLIIDTDGGVDDAIAVFMILSERLRPAQVLAITTVFGHTDVENATKNILRTLKVLEKDKDIPIYMGTTVGILKYPDAKDEREYYFGYEGYGETGYQGPSIDDLPKYHAVLAIIDAVKKYPGKQALILMEAELGDVTVFCTGPLTNIALAIRIYPQFVHDVKQVYILGGSVYRLDAMDTSNEFNFQQDPEALKIVFDPRIQLTRKIYFVSWENVSKMQISLDWRFNVLGKIKSRKMTTINKLEANVVHDTYTKSSNTRQWICPSAVLAAYYLKPQIVPIKPRISFPIFNIRKRNDSDWTNDVDFKTLPNLNRTEFQNMLIRYLT